MKKLIIHNSLKALCRWRKMTQKELAQKAGMVESQISGIATGKTNLSLANARRIASALGVPLWVVVGDFRPTREAACVKADEYARKYCGGDGDLYGHIYRAYMAAVEEFFQLKILERYGD